MTKKEKLQKWIVDALAAQGDSSVTEVAKHIWANHEADIKQAGDLLYTWQYEMRWAAQELQGKQILNKNLPGRKWGLR